MFITIKAGNSPHAVKTEYHELAQRLYAEALNLDDEAVLMPLIGGWEVHFISSEAECFEAVRAVTEQFNRDYRACLESGASAVHFSQDYEA